jgi:diaminopimelate decarboxylase
VPGVVYVPGSPDFLVLYVDFSSEDVKVEKKPFVTREQLEEIKKTYPTPFHLYDEKGIRENGERLMRAFSWNKGFREYFAVKATPNPFVIDILKKLGCGVDCSSLTELMMAKAMKYDGEKIMFSSNDTPPEEFKMAAGLGAIINLDDFTHIDFLEKTIGYIPETISCRYNPGGLFKISNDIMDNPGDAKYGMTTEQLFEAFKVLKAKGAKHFGIHAFLASNTVTNEYYPMLAKVLFEVAVKLKEETGADIKFINLSGGVGIPYRPDQEPNDIFAIGEGVRKVYEEVLVPAGMGDVALYTPKTVFYQLISRKTPTNGRYLLLFTHTCPVTEFAVASHLNTANSCCHHVFLRHFRFQKCLPVNSNWYFSPFLRQDTNSGQIESFSRYIYEPVTNSGAESGLYSTTITRMIFVSATGS